MSVFLDILQKRRSIRRYTGERIQDRYLREIIQAGLLSPSGKGACPWELIVVRDKGVLAQMSECRIGAARMLANADAAIVVLGDSTKTDTIIEDCSIVMSNMHIMSDSLGIGSCWIQGRLREAADGRSTEDYLRDLLRFPESYKLEAVLSLGVPAAHPLPHSIESLDDSKIHMERF